MNRIWRKAALKGPPFFEEDMPKVKSFGIEVQETELKRELERLDEIVNTFLTRNNVKNVISVSDTATNDDKGRTIGLVRVVCYED